MSKQKQNEKITAMVLCALFAAITAILSQVSVPMPSGVPITLQTFAVALCGYFLGAGKGAAAISVYIAIGAIGVPVFAGFKGGIASIMGLTGGFIIGFIALAALCGIGVKNPALKMIFGMAGLLALHLLGTAQYALLSGTEPIPAFLTVSAPYLIKDAVSVVLAYLAAMAMKKTLKMISRQKPAQ